jgi:fucose permease
MKRALAPSMKQALLPSVKQRFMFRESQRSVSRKRRLTFEKLPFLLSGRVKQLLSITVTQSKMEKTQPGICRHFLSSSATRTDILSKIPDPFLYVILDK